MSARANGPHVDGAVGLETDTALGVEGGGVGGVWVGKGLEVEVGVVDWFGVELCVVIFILDLELELFWVRLVSFSS